MKLPPVSHRDTSHCYYKALLIDMIADALLIDICHMSAKAQQSTQPMSLLEKYAIPYYAPCLQLLVVWAIYCRTGSPTYVAGFVLLMTYVGKLLPKDSFPVTHSVEHNKNIFHVFPLVADILFVWITMAKIFVDYPFKNYNAFQTSNAVTALVILISPSIDAAHQLLHRPQKVFQAIGFLNMALFQFTVYPIEHLYLHHKLVGTNQDPITSPKNQNYYAFTVKAFFSAHKFVLNKDPKAFALCLLTNWTYIGIMLWYALKQTQGSWEIALSRVGMFLTIGLFCFMFFEAVEYIQHYGLVYRQSKDEGKAKQICSWNCDDNLILNWLVFRFQRHSDHHMNAYKIYTSMELTDQMPRFPFNFIEGSFLALVPPLWFFMMNPYVDEVLDKKEVPSSHRKTVFWIKEVVSFVFLSRGIYLLVTTYLQSTPV